MHYKIFHRFFTPIFNHRFHHRLGSPVGTTVLTPGSLTPLRGEFSPPLRGGDGTAAAILFPEAKDSNPEKKKSRVLEL